MVEELTLPALTPTLASIERLERLITAAPQTEIPPVHHFSDGIYAREIMIPAGTVLTGKMHRTQHINVVSRGDITVWTERGMKRIRAPFTFVSQPGTKRAGYAHEDTVWTTFHSNPDNERDPVRLEEIFIIPSNNELKGTPCLGSP